MAQLDNCNLDQFAFQKWNGEISGNGCQKKRRHGGGAGFLELYFSANAGEQIFYQTI